MKLKYEYSTVHGMWEVYDTDSGESLGLYETEVDAQEGIDYLKALNPPLMDEEEIYE